MPIELSRYDSIDSFIEQVVSDPDFRESTLPKKLRDECCLHPDWAMEVFKYIQSGKKREKKTLNAA